MTKAQHSCENAGRSSAGKLGSCPLFPIDASFFSAIIWFVFLLIAVSGKGKPQRRKTERAWIEEADKGKDDAIKKKSRKIYWGSNELGFLWMWILVHAQLPVPTIAAGTWAAILDRKEGNGIQVDLLTNTVRCQSVGASSELELVQPHATWATDRWPFHYYYRCRCSGRGCRPSRATLQSHSPDSARKCRAAATIQ